MNIAQDFIHHLRYYLTKIVLSSLNLKFIIIISSIFTLLFIVPGPEMNNPCKEMSHTGLLIVSNLSRVQNVLARASQHVKKSLYIGLSAGQDNNLQSYCKYVAAIYTKSNTVCGNLDVRVLLKTVPAVGSMNLSKQVELILCDKELDSNPEYKDFMSVNQKDILHTVVLDAVPGDEVTSEVIKCDEEISTYDYVALGGTFDRLHNGHKILLSEAVLRTTKELTVGVTDVNMIKSKKFYELIEPLDVRISRLKEFLRDVNPNIEYRVVPIQDMYGPTKDDAKLQLLVVSKETIRGADKVNEKRLENGLPAMQVHCIELVDDHPGFRPDEEVKISSSNTRARLLGTLLRPPVENTLIPKSPYIIGLYGGVASGKSKLAEKLSKLGAQIVNCDILGHELYRPGLPLNQTIAETFGTQIISEKGEVDRKALGQIVFNDKNELEKLNNVMWPAILEEAQRRIQQIGAAGHRVAVMEAAVMLQAGWNRYCHQLWAVITPPHEAVRRLMERNGLSEEDASNRISAQPSNTEHVAAANIVFSSWNFEQMDRQAEKAWQNLQQYLDAEQ